MRGNQTALVVAEKTSRLQVDHRLPLRIYFRAADSILRQARIYRKENNLIDLYVLLLRFSSLVMETIPQHRDYRSFLGREKKDFRKRLLDVLNELETLKPLVQKEVCRYNTTAYLQARPSSNGLSTDATVLELSITRSQSFSGTSKGYSHVGNSRTQADSSGFYDSNNSNNQGYPPVGHKSQGDLSSKPMALGRQEYGQGHDWNGDFSGQPVHSARQQYSQASYVLEGDLSGRDRPVDPSSREDSQYGRHVTSNLSTRPVYSGAIGTPYSLGGFPSIEDRMSNLSFSIPTPTRDSLSRHSFLGSSVRKEPVSSLQRTKVQYPSLIDASPPLIPSLDQNWHSPSPIQSAPTSSPPRAVAEPVFYNEADMLKFEETHSNLVDAAVLLHSQLNIQPSPPPVAAEVKSLPVLSHSSENGSVEGLPCDNSSPPAECLKFSEDSLQARKPKQLHISVRLMDMFMDVANANTKSNLETCGVLAGSLKEGVFFVTTLIIPKQEGTANSCSTINEEDIFEYQDKHDLFQFGWIHTHPSQSCFMSSIDLHTHYSYQVMLPEAVAIVMAPTDTSRKYGIFRLAEPCGVKVIQSCDKRGFHPHNEPEDGGPIYELCGHVQLDPTLACDVVDLR